MALNAKTLTVTQAEPGPISRAFGGAAGPFYDPDHGWDTTWQPSSAISICINVADYLALARRAATPFERKISDFLVRQNLSVMKVSQREFQAEYERAEPDSGGMRIKFDDWVERKRAERGLSFYPDVVLIEPCVKSLDRSDGKVAFDNGNFHANKDYLRSNLIFTTGLRPAQRRANMLRMGDVKTSLIEDPDFGATSRKDQLAKPHDRSGYRGMHVTTTCTVNDGSEWDGISITAELKVEHAAMQDVLRMTRELQEVRRAMQGNLTGVQMSAGHFHYVRMRENRETLGELCRHLHNFVAKQAGLDMFLTRPLPGAKPANYTPLPARELAVAMKAAGEINMRVNNILAVNPLGIAGLNQPAYLHASVLC